jgi:hypothetical protein
MESALETKATAVGGSVPMPHDLDGTWCKVIGAMLGYALLVLRVFQRRQPAAIAMTLTCGVVYETPTCAFMYSSIVRTSQVPQGRSHLVVRLSARSRAMPDSRWEEKL